MAERAHIVLAHPEARSFTAALSKTAAETLAAMEWAVSFSDLYREGFDPVSDRRNFSTIADPDYFKQQAEENYAADQVGFKDDLRRYQQTLLNADLLLLCFPLWWGGMPAIMKGWVDRVFAAGVLYGGGRQFGRGVMAGKRAGLIVTTGGDEQFFREGVAGDLDDGLAPISRNILSFVGFEVLPTFASYAPARLSDLQRRNELNRLRENLENDITRWRGCPASE